MTVRVRIAPSPTGLIHVGNARSALFNWLFARHNGGTFIVRIDDTDQERSTAEFEEDITAGLRWLGLDWDEGIEVGGPHGSYRQSDRFDRYRRLAAELVDAGLAYHDPRTPEELDGLRNRAREEKRHPNHYIRRPDQVASAGPVRFAVPQDAAIEFDDLVRGPLLFTPDTVDDFVILRSDGVPTYHLASVADDIDYEITHVVRGEDLLPSTPKHIALTRALGADLPAFAHLPLLFGPDGKKLSKRHGDTSLRAYREGGYLPTAMVNFLALLGWSIGSDRTIFGMDEAVAAFELGAVSKNPAVFDLDKLAWMNAEYMRALPADDFERLAREAVEKAGLDTRRWPDARTLLPLVQERTRLTGEIPGQLSFLLEDDLDYDEESWGKVMDKEGVPEVLAAARGRLAALAGSEPAESELGGFEVAAIETELRRMLEELGLNARKGLQPIRVAVTGSSVSPPLFESLAALGRERTLARLDAALVRLG